MKCKKIKNLLYSYSTGELTGSGKAEIEEHLKECVGCSVLLTSMKKTLSLIDKYRAMPELDEGFFSRYTIKTLNRIRSSCEKCSPLLNANFYLKPAIVFAVILFVILAAHKTSFHKEQLIINNLEIVENIDLYQNLDLIENIDEIEKL